MIQNSKKILVTGATGKVGSRLIPRLLQLGYDVRALVREVSNASFLISLGAELAVGDLLDSNSLTLALNDVDIVIHLATFYKGATEDQSKMANIDGTKILAIASIEAGVKQFIFTSANRVYGNNRGKRVTENDPTSPAGNKFAVAKIEIENLLSNVLKNEDIIFCTLRLPLIYGDNDTHLKETIPMLNDWSPAKRIQLVHHADVAQAIKLAIILKASGVFNITDDAPITISELRQLYNFPDTPDELVSDSWEMIVSNWKIREQLGFRPIYSTFYTAVDAGTL